MVWLIPLCIAAVLILFVAAAGIAARVAFSRIFDRRYDGNPYLRYFKAEDFPDITAEPVSFASDGGQMLRGFIYRPRMGPAAGLIVFSHGFGAGHHAYTTEIAFLARNGFAVLAYDGTGCVASEGKFKGFDQGPVDVAAALRFAREHEALKGFRRVVLAGHSWGAFSVCNALDADERVAGAVAMCGFISSASVMGQTGGGRFRPLVLLFTFFFRMYNRRRFGENANRSALASLLKTEKDVLLLYGEKDKTVPFRYNGKKVAEEVSGRKNIVCRLFPSKAHNVYLTEAAEEYMHGAFAEIAARTKKGGDVARLYSSLDYGKMTEEDPEVMALILSFCRRIFSECEN